MPPESDPTAQGLSTPTGGGDTEPLQIRHVLVKLRDLTLLEGDDNAQHMSGEKYAQLVLNLKRDKILTSSPLVYKGVVRSGNHRVKAAMDAGIEEAMVIEVTNPDLDDGRVLALQMAHNSINGESDLNIEQKLYEKLDIAWKQYTSLTTERFEALQKLELKAFKSATPEYQELRILFLPEDFEAFSSALEMLAKRVSRGAVGMVGRFEDFDSLFDAIVKAKHSKGVHNTAAALRLLADLATKALEAEE